MLHQCIEKNGVFILGSEIYIFGALTFLILATGERQWWARKSKEERRVLFDGKVKLLTNNDDGLHSNIIEKMEVSIYTIQVSTLKTIIHQFRFIKKSTIFY